MQCLISKFTISGLGQVWDCQSYGEMVPSVPFPLSTGEWEVLLNNWRSIWIKGVNITVCNVILGAALKEGMDSPFSLCLAVVHSWVSPRHSQTLLQVLLAFGELDALSSMVTWGGMFAVPMAGKDKMWSEKASLVHLEWLEKYLQVTGVLKWSILVLS